MKENGTVMDKQVIALRKCLLICVLMATLTLVSLDMLSRADALVLAGHYLVRSCLDSQDPPHR